MADSDDQQQSEYVTLVSSDSFHFIIHRKAALVSGTLASMLSPTSQFAESRTNSITLESIEGHMLEKVIDYLYFHERYKDAKEVPEFVVQPEYALNLLVAADFLDGMPLSWSMNKHTYCI
ncbi:elongin-C [Protomyces lactucae-debilis]|uniref:Elongin-C n=1 Tax=Protomyces lactucae-debilis TaxID=2754530 RepID=A0A1Y2FPR3_PROLT|nr:elongin-C [Protomyces lactucae-debilis]ORY85597.1 elongin-C [Protomyces lactucae-debilis]